MYQYSSTKCSVYSKRQLRVLGFHSYHGAIEQLNGIIKICMRWRYKECLSLLSMQVFIVGFDFKSVGR